MGHACVIICLYCSTPSSWSVGLFGFGASYGSWGLGVQTYNQGGNSQCSRGGWGSNVFYNISNSWHYVATTMDSSGTALFYLDGVHIDT
jgi:hypothetical protein